MVSEKMKGAAAYVTGVLAKYSTSGYRELTGNLGSSLGMPLNQPLAYEGVTFIRDNMFEKAMSEGVGMPLLGYGLMKLFDKNTGTGLKDAFRYTVLGACQVIGLRAAQGLSEIIYAKGPALAEELYEIPSTLVLIPPVALGLWGVSKIVERASGKTNHDDF